MKKLLLLSSALVVLMSAMLLAGNEIKIGTAGAQELRIPVGSRGSALGGAMVANAYGAEALFWNPAGAANQTGTEAMFSHLEYFADMNLEYVVLPLNSRVLELSARRSRCCQSATFSGRRGTTSRASVVKPSIRPFPFLG